MKIYKKEWKQFIPRDIDEVWHFFSRPENLNAITPENMKFEIVSDIADLPMYEGMLIQYKVSPMLNISLDWTTEITHIEDKKYFIDEQRFGPYALWHHQHHFVEQDGGVMMTDLLHYAIGFGPIGRIANGLFVEKRVTEIFDYRKEACDKLFSSQIIA